MTAFKYFMKTERPSFVHAICPARYRVGEGATAERSIGVKPEELRRLKLKHAWQLLTMTDKDRLLTDISRTVVEFASGKSMHNRHS